MQHTSPVIVIGGGWSGLSAAVELASQDIPVTLLESARQIGGRARRVKLDDLHVDNGQHLIIGAYHETLSMFKRLGVLHEENIARIPMHLEVYSQGKPALDISVPKLPAPIHILLALFRIKGLSLRQRMLAAYFGNFIHRIRGALQNDISVDSLLVKYRQPQKLVRLLWEPLCIAMLNTPIREASAQLFVRVIYDALFKTHSDSDLVFARRDLGCLFPDPAMEYIEQRNGQVRLGRRVTGLDIDGKRVRGVITSSETLPAENVILATSPDRCADLLSGLDVLSPLVQKLNTFSYQPICTCYLQYPADVALDGFACGLTGSISQWVFDRRHTGQAGLMSVVISADGPHMQLDNDTLIQRISDELASFRPDWPTPLYGKVIREKRATFSCSPQINTIRPDCETAVSGLWLAGDYINTGYPATLEGAVLSGINAARKVVDSLSNNRTTDAI